MVEAPGRRVRQERQGGRARPRPEGWRAGAVSATLGATQPPLMPQARLGASRQRRIGGCLGSLDAAAAPPRNLSCPRAVRPITRRAAARVHWEPSNRLQSRIAPATSPGEAELAAWRGRRGWQREQGLASASSPRNVCGRILFAFCLQVQASRRIVVQAEKLPSCQAGGEAVKNEMTMNRSRQRLPL